MKTTNTTNTTINATYLPLVVDEETFKLVTQLTKDPVDTMRLISDFYSFAAFCHEWHAARDAGTPAPDVPSLRSNYLLGFVRMFAFGVQEVTKVMAKAARDYLDRAPAVVVQ